MNYSKLEYFLSEPRLNRFLVACEGSPLKAQKLYGINLKVSQAIYPVLNLFEIFLRNAVNYQIIQYFKDPIWIINQQAGFMSDSSLSKSGYFIKNSIQQAQRSIVKKTGTVTAGKIIAEQTFGFWTALFEPHHFRLIGGSPLQSFKNKPANINRSHVAVRLNAIRKFRNRVYHNEPICFQDTVIDFLSTYNIRQHIWDLLGWIDPELISFITQFDHIDENIRELDSL